MLYKILNLPRQLRFAFLLILLLFCFFSALLCLIYFRLANGSTLAAPLPYRSPPFSTLPLLQPLSLGVFGSHHVYAPCRCLSVCLSLVYVMLCSTFYVLHFQPDTPTLCAHPSSTRCDVTIRSVYIFLDSLYISLCFLPHFLAIFSRLISTDP